MDSTTRRERIAVITTSFPRYAGDAAGHFVLAEVRELARSGAQVTVIAAGHGSERPADCDVRFAGGDSLFDWPGALPRLRQRPLRAFGALAFLHEARRVLRQAGPFDRVVAHWLVPSAFPIMAGLWPGGTHSEAKLEVVAHGSDVRLLARCPTRVRSAVLEALVRRRARLRFVSHALRDELTNAPGLSRELRDWLTESEVRPAALDVTGATSRLEARARHGVGVDERLVVIASRLVPEKRIDVAIGAASLVPETRVVVVGGGPEQARLEALYPEATFLGQQPRGVTLEWLVAADVVVSASREEGAPTVVREARTLGVPVVARAAGDLELWSRRDPELWVL